MRRRALLAAAAAPALTQEAWPSRPVTFISPFAAGGQADPLGRLLAAHLQRVFGQPFVMENRVGAGSTIGGQYVARAAPDGHTLLLGSTSTYVIAPFVYRPQPYDPVTAFAPVAMLTEAATALVTHPGRGFRTLDDVLRAARARPGGVTFASAGNGSLPHVFGALFASLAGVELTHVPYRGGAPALNDVFAGQVDLLFEVVSTVGLHIADGRVVALLTTGAIRLPGMPDAPTAAEAGLAALNLTSWIGLAAPARTPAAVIEALNREVNVALASEPLAAFVARAGSAVVGGAPAAMAARLAREAPVYQRIIAASRFPPVRLVRKCRDADDPGETRT